MSQSTSYFYDVGCRVPRLLFLSTLVPIFTTMTTSRRSLRAILFSISFGIYGLVCYHIGEMVGRNTAQINDWLPPVSLSTRDREDANSKKNQQMKLPGGEIGLHKLIDESKLPYKCGVLLYYHIPSTGGSSINKWLQKYNATNTDYFTKWGSGKAGGSEAQKVEIAFIEGMNLHVKNIAQGEWKIAHAHINSIHLNASENYLYNWRSSVEKQGCHFIATVMFRDPLSHALSLYKHQSNCDCSRDQWIKHLTTKSEIGYWSTQLDFFLYNKFARNPNGDKTEEKVRRGLELLQRHFDVVMVGDHVKFMNAILEMTGWEKEEMSRTNSFVGQLTFTKKEVEKLQKLLRNNGDIDFISGARLLISEISFHD